jgi:YD repeat-containing protein
MADGTGTTTYTYDQLDRLTEAEAGHKEKVKYEYDLANEQTKIT